MNDLLNLNRPMTKAEKQAMKTMTDSEGLILPQSAETAKKLLHNEKVDKYNEQVQAFEDRFDAHVEAMNSMAEKLSENMNGVEIMPVYGYILIKPFTQNPFQKLKRLDSGIIIANGFAPTYKSEEDGQFHEEQELVRVGEVVEVGHKCEFIKPGDYVMYPTVSEVKVPFFDFGFVMVNEQRVICVVNEKLTERKNDVKHGNND